MKARNGKIAGLPPQVREALNLRLERNEPGPRLLAWLNGLPETRPVLAAKFDGEPVSLQNLSQWRLGGFLDWRVRRELFAELKFDDGAGMGPGTDAGRTARMAADLLARSYTQLLLQWDRLSVRELKVRAGIFAEIGDGIAQLQRVTHRFDGAGLALKKSSQIALRQSESK